MNIVPRKKLIEIALPLEAINAASAKEKSIRHGHPSTLHLWWARRPLAACRAVLFAQLVDDPSAWPDRFPTPDAVSAERERLHQIIRDMVPWSASSDETILGRARREIARSVAWSRGEEPPPAKDRQAVIDYLQRYAPSVCDPFCGGGSIPFEAQRLGLRAVGSDLNPVAVLISKAMVEIPPKFSGRSPVNPESRARPGLIGQEWRGAQGLAEDVRYYGRWMRDEAERQVGHLYPKARLSDGTQATVIAWIWARTVRSPDPLAKGAMVPLASTYMLSTRDGRKTWVEVVLDASSIDGYRFDIRSGSLDAQAEQNLKLGSKSAQGQAFICAITKSPIPRSYIQAEGKAGRLGCRLLATVCDGQGGRVYLSPTPELEGAAIIQNEISHVNEVRDTFLSGETPTRAMITGGVCSAYGLSTWGRLFTDRQVVALTTFSDLVIRARENVRLDAIRAGWRNDDLTLEVGGDGATAFADAIAVYLGLSVSRQVNRATSLNFWDSGAGNIQQAFGRQAFAMTWDFAESNPFSSSSGNFSGQVEYLANVLAAAPSSRVPATIVQANATLVGYPMQPVCIATDPPYYDNIGYATLSDFFYVWLRKSLIPVLPDLFRRLQTPKQEELVATPIRHGGKDEAEAFFLNGMVVAITAMRAAIAEFPLTMYYAFKQSEAGEDGVSSSGWAAFLQAVIDAGLTVDGTWPVRTELVGNLKKKINALASSIVLVCRKRDPNARVTTREELIRVLRREMPPKLHTIRVSGVGPVDMAQAAIGPGMAVFSRYRTVLEDSGEPMSVRTGLALINQIRDEIDHDDDAAYDAETRFALDWFSEVGWDFRESGRAILLANAKNLALDRLSRLGLIETPSGRTRLIPREAFDPDHDATGGTPVVWMAAQHLAHALVSSEGGQERAAEVFAGFGPGSRELVRALAYRLYGLAERKGWAQEALVWNRVAEEWGTIEAITENVETRPPSRETSDLFGARP